MRNRHHSLLLTLVALMPQLAACEQSASGGHRDEAGLADPAASGWHAAWAEDPWTPTARPASNTAPETPSILRDVALIDDDVRFTRPYIPGHRTTMDGRVAIRVQGGPPGPERLTTSLSFFLFVPERLEAPVLAGPAGPAILGDVEPFDVEFSPALIPGTKVLGHHAICDAHASPLPTGATANPYACGDALDHDCYDITIVSTTSNGADAQLWGTFATVKVASPKTSSARIVDVRLGEPVAGGLITASTELAEPTVTRDGRLLTGRLGRAIRIWRNPRTNKVTERPYELAYSVLPEGATPCDVTGWTDFHPMSHAPFDPAMTGRYGLANYPFRDSEGRMIADGEDLGGTYPWVDREGANVFMTAIPGRISEQSPERFPRRCVVEGCETYVENVDWDRGFLVGGAWTHGKFVVLDAMVNHLDWAVGVTPAAHWLVDLYRDASGAPVSVRLGAGRYIDSVRERGGPYPAGYTHNANILDSLQNTLNHNHHVRTITPRDVVWLMSTGVATDEVVFDDLLDPNAFVVSNMQASVTQQYDEYGGSLSVPIHWNGQKRELKLPIPLAALNVLYPDEDEEIHIQNAATSLDWAVPAFGLMAPGDGRIEPAALGGIKGKGLWLDGHARVDYPVSEQPRDVRSVPWYIGIFFDSRALPDEERTLLSFPDGTLVEVAGRSRLRFVVEGMVRHEVPLPDGAPTHGWRHLGLRVSVGGRAVEVLHDGFPIDRWLAARPVLGLVPGNLTVGAVREDQGFRGWVDDLVILAHDVDAEVACNHARGTLVRVTSHSGWAVVASQYPEWAHASVMTGDEPGTHYACFHDYRGDNLAHLGAVPPGTSSVRADVTFPEGPVRAGVPRPDSRDNLFCRTCHHEGGKGGLSLAALAPMPGIPAELDRRRQPHQPPARVHGVIPRNWISGGPGPGGPDAAFIAPPEGAIIDPWLLPDGDGSD